MGIVGGSEMRDTGASLCCNRTFLTLERAGQGHVTLI